jgi:hypothetical protein
MSTKQVNIEPGGKHPAPAEFLAESDKIETIRHLAAIMTRLTASRF